MITENLDPYRIAPRETKKYWPHQLPWIKELINSMALHQRTMGQLSTGGGKTFCFCKVIEMCVKKRYKVLALVHRDKLVDQISETLWKDYGVRSGVIKSGQLIDYQTPVQVAMVQTLSRRTKPPGIKVIVIDEAHRAKASQYKKIIEHYPDAYILAVTATPIRLDGQGFGDIFNDLVCGPQIKELEKQGSLVPARCYSQTLDLASLNKVRKTAGDYNEKQLVNLMMGSQVMTGIYNLWRQHAYNTKTITFAVNTLHGKAIAEMYRGKGIATEWIDGTTKNKKKYYDALEQGKFSILVNCQVAIEGVDIRAINCVQMALATMSLGKYLQIAGRGARANKAYGKTHYVLLDHGNNIFQHNYPNADRVWNLHGSKKPMKLSDDSLLKFTGPGVADMYCKPSNFKGDLNAYTNISVAIESKLPYFKHCLMLARRKKYKPYWAFMQYRNRYAADITLKDMMYVAKCLNYGPQWGRKKYNEIKAELNKTKR